MCALNIIIFIERFTPLLHSESRNDVMLLMMSDINKSVAGFNLILTIEVDSFDHLFSSIREKSEIKINIQLTINLSIGILLYLHITTLVCVCILASESIK